MNIKIYHKVYFTRIHLAKEASLALIATKAKCEITN